MSRHQVPTATHFDVLYPGSLAVASAILADVDRAPRFEISAAAISDILTGLRSTAKPAEEAE